MLVGIIVRTIFFLRKGTKKESCCPCSVQSVLPDEEPPWSECSVMPKQIHLGQTQKRFRKNPRAINGTWLVIRSPLTSALELGSLSRFLHSIAFTGWFIAKVKVWRDIKEKRFLRNVSTTSKTGLKENWGGFQTETMVASIIFYTVMLAIQWFVLLKRI